MIWSGLELVGPGLALNPTHKGKNMSTNKYMTKEQTINVYAIYDNKAETFKVPFLMINNAVAVRAFTDVVRGQDNDISKYPGDFDLYNLGTFNQNTGKYESNTPTKVINGADLKAEEK